MKGISSKMNKRQNLKIKFAQTIKANHKKS